MRINLDDLALELSDELDMTRAGAKRHLTALFACIAENVSNGHEVNIVGFGKFARRDRPARKGRNPKTGEETEIPAKSIPKFTAAKALKDACAEKGI
jgi:DNA-binding protein HU-beta